MTTSWLFEIGLLENSIYQSTNQSINDTCDMSVLVYSVELGVIYEISGVSSRERALWVGVV